MSRSKFSMDIRALEHISEEEIGKNDQTSQHLSPPRTIDWFKSNKFNDDIFRDAGQNIIDIIPSPGQSKAHEIFEEEKKKDKSNEELLFIPPSGSKKVLPVNRKNPRKSTFLTKIRDVTANVHTKLQMRKRKTVNDSEIAILKNKYIRKWLDAIRMKKKLANPENLTKKQLYLIGETAIGSQYNQKKREAGSREGHMIGTVSNFMIHFMKKNFVLIASKIPVINPESRFKIMWNVLICLCIPYQLFLITIEIFFDSNWNSAESEHTFAFSLVEHFLRYLFLFDLLLNFTTGFYEKGTIIYDKKKIIKNYLKKFFIVDALTIIPLFLEINNSSALAFSSRVTIAISIIKFLFVFRLLYLSRTFALVEQILTNSQRLEVLIALLKLSLYIIGTAHMLACIWYYIGVRSLKMKNSSWLQNQKVCSLELDSCDWRTYYIYSLYWAITTMITVGYGDITPTNEFEVGYCLVSMIFGCGMFGYSINKIGAVFETLRSSEKFFKHKIKLINQYMNREQVDFDLQVRVRRYLEYIFMEAKNEKAEEEQKIIKTLSNNLRKELLMQTNGKLLLLSPVFSNNFSKSTVEKLSELMVQQDFAHEEIVFEERSTENDKLYFISKGRIDTFVGCENGGGSYLRLNSLRHGNVVGELAFFTGSKHKFSAISVGFTKLFYVNRANFLDVLREEPEDYEKFCLMRDKFLNYANPEDFHHPCACCDKLDHHLEECPFLRYTPNKLNLMLKNKLAQKSKKKYFPRRKKSRNALRNMNKLHEAMQEFQKNYELSNESGSDECSQEEKLKFVSSNKIHSPVSGSSVNHLELEFLEKSSPKNYCSLEGAENDSYLNKYKSSTPSHSAEQQPQKYGPLAIKHDLHRKEETGAFSAKIEATRRASIERASGKRMTKLAHDPAPHHMQKGPANNNDQTIKVESDFDKIKDFKTYFPYNNSMKILRKINETTRAKKTTKYRNTIADNRKLINELINLHKSYSKGLFVKVAKALDKSKFKFATENEFS